VVAAAALRRWMEPAIRCVLMCGGVVVLFLGAAKAVDVEGFRQAIVAQGIIAPALAGPGAPAFVLAEIACALFVIVRSTSSGGGPSAALVLLVLLLVLTMYTAAVGLHPPPRPVGCGCGWSSRPVDSWPL
jgi:hypothetical protein